MTAQTISQQASVAPEAAALKRGLRMSWFADKKDHMEIGLEFEKTRDVAACTRAMGQIVGIIFEVEERTFTTPEGESVTSLVAIGDFEAVKYATGEVVSIMSASLPRYFLESIKAALGKGHADNAQFAVEILLTPTGKQVPTAYEVKNLIPREANSPLNALKARLQSANRLKGLPAPTASVVALDTPDAIEGQFTVADTEPAAGAEQPVIDAVNAKAAKAK